MLAIVNTADEIAPLNTVKPFLDEMPIKETRIIEYPGEAASASDCNISHCLPGVRRMLAFGLKLSLGSGRHNEPAAVKAARPP